MSVAMATLVIIGGCDATIEPFSEKSAYSIQGYVNVAPVRQFIRIKPLRVPLTEVWARPLEATVTLERVEDGNSTALRDSVISFRDANTKVHTHNYWTDFQIDPRTKYRLMVDGPYGTTHATAITPTGTRPKVTPSVGGCRKEVTVVFRDMPSPRRHQARVAIKPPDTTWVSYRQHDSDFRGYPFDLFKTNEGWLAMTFVPENLVKGLPNLDLPEIPPRLIPRCWTPNPCAGLKLTTLQVWFLYLGPKWYGDISTDSLTYDPLESRKVANGLGFFGAVVRDWVPFRVTQTPKFYFTRAEGCERLPSL